MASKKEKIIFSHQGLPDLKIDVNPDQITWSYGLNTMNYPTFGGEVVQILSMFIEDMTISGTVSSYTKMESIYKWFVLYMQLSTQGHGTKSKKLPFDTTPVSFYYPARGWKFLIQPKAAPGFRYGKDVVAPTWSVQAAVVESPESFDQLIKSEAEINAMQDPAFKPFGTATAEIGFNEFNPWTTPNTGKKYKAGAVEDYLDELSGPNGPFNSFMKSFLETSSGRAAVEALGTNSSKPAFLASTNQTGNQQSKENAKRTYGSDPGEE